MNYRYCAIVLCKRWIVQCDHGCLRMPQVEDSTTKWHDLGPIDPVKQILRRNEQEQCSARITERPAVPVGMRAVRLQPLRGQGSLTPSMVAMQQAVKTPDLIALHHDLLAVLRFHLVTFFH